MLNRSASLAMSTSVLKALPGKLDIKRRSPSILYLHTVYKVMFLLNNCKQNITSLSLLVATTVSKKVLETLRYLHSLR